MKKCNDGERRFVLRSANHAPFWESVILTACASGDILSPVIIHKGGTYDKMQVTAVLIFHLTIERLPVKVDIMITIILNSLEA